MWRCGNGAKVWYEWATTAPQVRDDAVVCVLACLCLAHCESFSQASPVHNPNGRSYFVGL